MPAQTQQQGQTSARPNPAASSQQPGLAGAQQAPVSPSGPTVEVRAGDTLSAIAQRALGDSRRWQELAQLNGLTSGTPLRPGQKLRLPASVQGPRGGGPQPSAPNSAEEPPAAPALQPPPPAAGGKDQAPKKGAITFGAEGSADPRSPFYSRRLHWPGGGSGVTIGRGYDCKERTAKEVVAHLTAAGVGEGDAKRISGGCKMAGDAAQSFVRANRDIEISAEQELALFGQVYDEKEAYAAGCVKRWSNTNFAELSQPMKDVLVDLFYRGDLTRTIWEKLGIAKIAEANNLTAMVSLLFDKRNWPGVDANRYIARMDMTADAIAPNRPPGDVQSPSR